MCCCAPAPNHKTNRYTFEEVAAARKIQATWGGLQGRRAFRQKLANESMRGLCIACINEAASHAWIGHKEVRNTLCELHAIFFFIMEVQVYTRESRYPRLVPECLSGAVSRAPPFRAEKSDVGMGPFHVVFSGSS